MDQTKNTKEELNFPLINSIIMEEINLARTQPSTYAAKLERISTTISKGNKINVQGKNMILKEGIACFDEAIQYLLNIDPLEPIEFIDALSKSADELLNMITIQEGVNMKKLEASYLELEQRLDHFGVFFGEFSELVDYGCTDPEFVVVNFITCDGDDNRKDRKIIFNPLLKYGGITSGLLPSEKICTILNFVQYFYNPGEEIPETMLNRYTYRPGKVNFFHMRQQSSEVYLEKKESYQDHFESKPLIPIIEEQQADEKKVKKVKVVEKKIKDKTTGKEIVVVKKTITYEDGAEEVETYTK